MSGNIQQRNSKSQYNGELATCARCGFGYVKATMVLQGGKLLCNIGSVPEPGGTVVGCVDEVGHKEGNT